MVNSNGPFLPLAPFLEQRAAFDAFNFNLSMWHEPNLTVHAVGIATLWCPSDPIVAEAQTVAASDPLNIWGHPCTFAYTSYCGNQGPWVLWGSTLDPAILNQNLGLFHQQSAVSPAQVTDGLSQTILFGEHAHGLLDRNAAWAWHWWVSSVVDTNFLTWYGVNPHHRLLADSPDGPFSWAAVVSAASFHPGGAHFAFADGSVRFLKETIDSTAVDPAIPIDWNLGVNGASWDATRKRVVLAPGTRLGVFQALSTRSGGEVISADAY
jgi:prepilin-type processing-associated H-X9-DG protein